MLIEIKIHPTKKLVKDHITWAINVVTLLNQQMLQKIKPALTIAISTSVLLLTCHIGFSHFKVIQLQFAECCSLVKFLLKKKKQKKL